MGLYGGTIFCIFLRCLSFQGGYGYGLSMAITIIRKNQVSSSVLGGFRPELCNESGQQRGARYSRKNCQHMTGGSRAFARLSQGRCLIIECYKDLQSIMYPEDFPEGSQHSFASLARIKFRNAFATHVFWHSFAKLFRELSRPAVFLPQRSHRLTSWWIGLRYF